MSKSHAHLLNKCVDKIDFYDFNVDNSMPVIQV